MGLLSYNRFEIFWVDLAPTKGAEITKKRPCLIISPNELHYLQTRIIAPITSKGFDAPFRVNFTLKGKKARILCDQIRCVSTQRLHGKIAVLGKAEQKQILQILQEMFGE